MCSYISIFWDCAAALQHAIETASMAFAPKFDLLDVPSRSIIIASIFSCSNAEMLFTAGNILLLMFSTAFKTLLFKYFLFSSLSS